MWLPLFLVAIAQSSSLFDQLSILTKEPLYSSSLNMGKTIKGKPLTVYFLTKVKFTEVAQLHGRSAVLIDSYMHAREPYSLQFLQTLVKVILQKSTSEQIDYFLSHGVFIFYPFVNPDGYQRYTQGDTSVRKNMNTNGTKCQNGQAGVDINRNFPSSFGTVSGSNLPCWQEYHGSAPFSENQSKVFRDIYEKFKVVIAVDVHSYGNQWIYPYASDITGLRVKKHNLYPFYTNIQKEFLKRGRKTLSCIQSLKYIADGVYIDWALDQGALSYAFEVGASFQNDPPEQITKDIEKGIEDFFIILQKTAQKFQAKVKAKQLILISESLVKMRLSISVGNKTVEGELIPNGRLEVPILPSDTHAIITNLGTNQQQTISLKIRGGGINITPFGVACVMGVFLAGMLLSFYTRWQALKQREAQLHSVSQQELPSITMTE